MPKFAKSTPAPAPSGGARAALKAAIDDRDRARHALNDAVTAEAKAREQSFEARRVVDRLRAEAMEPPADESAVRAAIQSDDVDALLELDRPRIDRGKALEQAERMARTWRGVADRAEETIEARTRALDEAEKLARKCAAAVLADELSLAEMLEDARAAARWIVGQRAAFLWLIENLPDTNEIKAIREFLAAPWLIGELSGEYRHDPSIASYRAALEALAGDAGAEIEISPP